MARRFSKAPKTTSSGNIKKYEAYKEAFTRINLAISKSFYFEAVTLAESIISDRLLSYAKGKQISSFIHGKANPKARAWDVRTSFAELISSVKYHVETSGGPKQHKALFAKLDGWRGERNKLVHGLAKSEPGADKEPLAEILKRAKSAALSGRKLSRDIVAWHKRA